MQRPPACVQTIIGSFWILRLLCPRRPHVGDPLSGRPHQGRQIKLRPQAPGHLDSTSRPSASASRPWPPASTARETPRRGRRLRVQGPVPATTARSARRSSCFIRSTGCRTKRKGLARGNCQPRHSQKHPSNGGSGLRCCRHAECQQIDRWHHGDGGRRGAQAHLTPSTRGAGGGQSERGEIGSIVGANQRSPVYERLPLPDAQKPQIALSTSCL